MCSAHCDIDIKSLLISMCFFSLIIMSILTELL